MIELTSSPIDTTAILASVQTTSAGASVLFVGSVRERTGDQITASLEYEAYESMALQAMGDLLDEAREKWPLLKASIVHRVGHLQLGEVAVAVAVSSAHRQPSFEAGQWLIDELKQRVPIWKKENYANGQTEWVHPTQKSVPTSVAPDTGRSSS